MFLQCKTTNDHPAHHIFAKIRRPSTEIDVSFVPLPDCKQASGMSIGILYLTSLKDKPFNCGKCNTVITKYRYKCGSCGINLCQKCEDLQEHDHSHIFLELPHYSLVNEDQYVSTARQETYYGYKIFVRPEYKKQSRKLIAQSYQYGVCNANRLTIS